jgi:hypothetical protein
MIKKLNVILVFTFTTIILCSCGSKRENNSKSSDLSELGDNKEYELSINGYPNEIPITAAVEEFNKRAKADSTGSTQPPLTVEELKAAIRGWSETDNPYNDTIFVAFQNIVKTGMMPKGSYLYFIPGLVGINGCNVSVWWINLNINLDKYPRDLVEVPQYSYRIRTVFISSSLH